MNDKLSITKRIIERIKNTFLSNKESIDKISIGDLISSLETSGFGVVMLIFSLPILVPLPPPIPTLISLPLLLFSTQMIFGLSSPKLPKILANRSIKRNILAMIVEKSSPYLSKLDKFVRPRLTAITNQAAEKFIGIFCFIFSISILIPIPFTNLIPGIGIIIISLGLISRDGVFIIFGFLTGIVGTVITIITIFSGIKIFNFIF